MNELSSVGWTPLEPETVTADTPKVAVTRPSGSYRVIRYTFLNEGGDDAYILTDDDTDTTALIIPQGATDLTRYECQASQQLHLLAANPSDVLVQPFASVEGDDAVLSL